MRTVLTFWFPPEHHPADDLAPCKAAAHDLHHAHVVDVEVFGIWGHDGQRCFRDQARELVLVAVLF